MYIQDDDFPADSDKVPDELSPSPMNLPSSLTITTKSKELLSKDIKDAIPSATTSAPPLPFMPQPDKQVGQLIIKSIIDKSDY